MQVKPIDVPPAYLNIYRPLWQAAMLRRYLLYTRTCTPRKISTSTFTSCLDPLRDPWPFVLYRDLIIMRPVHHARQRDNAYAAPRPSSQARPQELDIEWPSEITPCEPQIITVERPVPVEYWIRGSVLDVLF